MPHSGSCLCGQTKVLVKSTQTEQIACHCLDCQQTSGSAHSMNILPKQTDVEITGPTKNFDIKAPSGNTVTRIFCSNCGAAVAHKSVAFGDAMAIQTGLLPDFQKIPCKTELFVKNRWATIPEFPGAAQVQAMP